MTLQQLRVYDGESEACDGSICVAGALGLLCQVHALLPFFDLAANILAFQVPLYLGDHLSFSWWVVG